MKSLWVGVATLGLGLCGTVSFGQILNFDESIPGYALSRETNAISSLNEIDSWSFDALAGDLVTLASANLVQKKAVGIQAKASIAGTLMDTGPAGSADAGNTDNSSRSSKPMPATPCPSSSLSRTTCGLPKPI